MIPTIPEMYDLSLASHRSTGSLGELMLGLGKSTRCGFRSPPQAAMTRCIGRSHVDQDLRNHK